MSIRDNREKGEQLLLSTSKNKIVSRLSRAIELGEPGFVKKLIYYLSKERKSTRCAWAELLNVPIDKSFAMNAKSIGLDNIDSLSRIANHDHINVVETNMFCYEDFTRGQRITLGRVLRMLTFIQRDSSIDGKRIWVRRENITNVHYNIKILVEAIQSDLGGFSKDEVEENEEGISFNNLI